MSRQKGNRKPGEADNGYIPVSRTGKPEPDIRTRRTNTKAEIFGLQA